MTTALIIPFGNDGTESGQARQRIWDRVWELWIKTAGARVLPEGPADGCGERVLMVAADPLFGKVREAEYLVPDGPMWTNVHRFSVARAVNNAVRLAPPEVDRFVTIGADALPDWRVVDWAAAELEHRPWTLLFGKGGNVSEAGTEDFARGAGVGRMWLHENGPEQYDVRPFETPCVGPIAFTREAFLAVRGYDERFEGWAYEDVDFWARLRQLADGPEYAATSPYPLIQFDHPTGHHDLTDGNPNVRLWDRKQADAQREGYRRNDHPADHLFLGNEVGPVEGMLP